MYRVSPLEETRGIPKDNCRYIITYTIKNVNMRIGSINL